MAVSYEEALAECVRYYAEKGVVFYPRPDERDVFRVYEIIQKEKEISKRIRKRPYAQFGDWTIYEPYWIDDDNPAELQ